MNCVERMVFSDFLCEKEFLFQKIYVTISDTP